MVLGLGDLGHWLSSPSKDVCLQSSIERQWHLGCVLCERVVTARGGLLGSPGFGLRQVRGSVVGVGATLQLIHVCFPRR